MLHDLLLHEKVQKLEFLKRKMTVNWSFLSQKLEFRTAKDKFQRILLACQVSGMQA